MPSTDQVIVLTQIINDWGICRDLCRSDMNGDGVVDVLDLLRLLQVWGADGGGDMPPLINGIPEGYMIFEGDIIVPKGFSYTNKTTFATELWPSGVVPFRFDANVSASNQALMLIAMTQWEAVAVVDFVPRNGETDFIHIRDSSGDPNPSNSAPIGLRGGQGTVNIVSWNNNWIMCHELAHALGFWHEQSRWDRDIYVDIVEGNISQTACSGGPCDSQFAVRPNFGPFGSREWGPYDFDSVMHYSACAFTMCAPGACTAPCRTINVLAPWNTQWQNAIGQRNYLSRLDQFTMKFLYPEANFRFVDRTNGGGQTGGFYWPLQSFTAGENVTPVGGTLWIIKEGSYSAVGTHSKPMTIRAPLGATLGS